MDEFFQYKNFRFLKLNRDDFSKEKLLRSPIYPKMYFENRTGDLEWLGLGEIPATEAFFDLVEHMPDDFYFFVQRDFKSPRTIVFIPQFQKNFSKESSYFIESDAASFDQFKGFLKNTSIPETQSFDDLHVVNKKEIPDFESWKKLFTKIQKDFKENVFQKIVPARKISLELNDSPDVENFFFKIRRDGNYNFYFSTKNNGTFLGSSPERLAAFEGGYLFTEAVAGTRPKEQAQELLSSTKDLYEHRLVVEDIFQKLKPFCLEILKDEKPQLVESKNLAHLKTSFKAKLMTSDFFSILDSLHPTSAICGMPKKETMDFLAENEAFSREKYAGFMGLMNKKRADISVTIRSCNIVNNRIDLYSGVGVVPQSDCAQEWQELNDKILPYLELFTQKNR